MTKKFHLGWFMNFIPPEWDTPWPTISGSRVRQFGEFGLTHQRPPRSCVGWSCVVSSVLPLRQA